MGIHDLKPTPDDKPPNPSHHHLPPPPQPPRWVVFTPRERVSPPLRSPTRAPPPPGSRPLLSRSSSRLASSPGRVPPLRRLESSSVTPTALPRSRLSPVTAFCASSRLRASLPRSPRTFTCSQEGRLRPQAPRAQPQGQGLQ